MLKDDNYLDKPISYHKNNIRAWFVEPSNWENKKKLTYREVIKQIIKDKSLKFKIEETFSGNRLSDKKEKHYVVYLGTKRLREFPKEIYKAYQEVNHAN
jgi:hypothetical protein